MVRITGGDCSELIVVSVYLPYNVDKLCPTKEMWDIITYCCSRKKQPILGCDANAQYILWGSTDTSPRGEALLEYLVCCNLNILNQGNHLPTLW